MTDPDPPDDPPVSPYPDEAPASPYPDEEPASPDADEAPAADRVDPAAAPTGSRKKRSRPRERPARKRSSRQTSRDVVPVSAPAGWLEQPSEPAAGATVFETLEDTTEVPPWYEDEYYEYDDDWGTLPSRSSTFRRALLFLVVFAGVVLGTAFLVNRVVQGELDPTGPPGDEIVIDIPDGAATNDIARILGDAGVVPNGVLFKYYLQWKDAGGFQAGTYLLNENMAVWEAREVLEAGPQPDERNFFIVPEGLRNDQMVALVLDEVDDFDPEGFAEAVESARTPAVFGNRLILSTEGFLFPAGYSVPDDARGEEETLVDQMVTKFDEVATEVGLGDAESRVGFSPYDVLIIASLIEEETAVESERPKVARVIYNRLERDEPLGIDATTLYRLASEGKEVDELRTSDFDADLPYDTRFRRGLPPTPISAPSQSSLEAALNPEDGPWLFYARTDEFGEGTHRFTVTLEEHEDAVEVCREKDLGC